MRYSGNQLKEISFPLGGIGSGSIGLAGNGSLIDWEIRNRPDKGNVNGYSSFVIKAEYADGRSVTKVLQADHTKELTGHYCQRIYAGFGHGPESDTMCGLPHFEEVEFDGTFPIATLTFRDSDFPGTVVMTAFNPFIPLHADDSSIPAAFFDIAVQNGAEDVTYTLVFSVNNPFSDCVNEKLSSDRYTAVRLKSGDKQPDEKDYGDITIAVDRSGGLSQAYWYRGEWRDTLSTFWHEMTRAQLTDRIYDTPGKNDVASVGTCVTLAPGCSEQVRFVVAWNVPNNYNYWDAYRDENGNDILWKNYYAVLFEDSTASCFYALDNWDRLWEKTRIFRDSLHGMTLDPAVIDAVSSTLSVLKSPTVFRLENGAFYGWEGLHEKEGSCEGTCTHVWSYAYALCFLFPELERSLRETEFTYDVYDNGSMRFRTKLPIRKDPGDFRPCLDGQMATVIKTYREWKISGDDTWLREHWDTVRRVLEFAWHPENFDEWDRDRDGVLEGRQHHTLDLEMFGPSAWLEGMYLAALKAAAEMAAYLGETDRQAEYLELFDKGYAFTKENLFNGKYFFHKIDLKRKDYTEHFDCPHYWNEEKQELKYQIGEGCAIDQMLAQWHANLCGLGDVFDKEQRQIALRTLFDNNFKPSMRKFANIWRVYALNDEAGAIICDYPEGCNRPVIAIPYCDECMTGFEYAFAGLLISEGYLEEGLQIVRAIRDRYDGEKRNPWNEIECGSNYARAMASFALLPIYSGFTFDMPKKQIGFAPRLSGDFNCLWSLNSGWGEFIRTDDRAILRLKDGTIELSSLRLGNCPAAARILADGKEIAFTDGDDVLSFADTTITQELVVEFAN